MLFVLEIFKIIENCILFHSPNYNKKFSDSIRFSTTNDIWFNFNFYIRLVKISYLAQFVD